MELGEGGWVRGLGLVMGEGRWEVRAVGYGGLMVLLLSGAKRDVGCVR